MRPSSPGGCSLITESGTCGNSLRCPSFDVAGGPEVLPSVGLPASTAGQASAVLPRPADLVFIHLCTGEQVSISVSAQTIWVQILPQNRERPMS